MDWEAAAIVGEIVGSIAVVISLVYLSVQIRHANKQSEIDSLRHTWDGLNQFCDRLSESTDTASIVNRGRQSLQSLDGDEYLVFEHIHLRLLNTLESWYLQVTQTSKPGPNLDSQLANISGIASGYFGDPGSGEMWRILRPYFESIAEFIDSGLASGGE